MVNGERGKRDKRGEQEVQKEEFRVEALLEFDDADCLVEERRHVVDTILNESTHD